MATSNETAAMLAVSEVRGVSTWGDARGFQSGEKRVEYKDNHNNEQNNLNGEEDLIVLNYVSITIGLQCFLE